MKVKTTLTLPDELLADLDQLAGPGISRSTFVERILRDFLDQREGARRLALDVAAINEHAARLNAEMVDVVSFQAPDVAT